MNSVITKVMLAADMNFGERLAYGAQVLIIGMMTVFLSLAILWGVIAIFKIFMYDMPQKRAKKKAEAALSAVPAAEPAAVTSAESTVSESDNDNTELVAVITAAVAAYMAQDGSALPFRVVSYKRVRGRGGWSGADENEGI